jgi:AAA domain
MDGSLRRYFHLSSGWRLVGEQHLSRDLRGTGHGAQARAQHQDGVRFDGTTPEFHCFAGGCRGSEMSFGDVVKHLNKYHEKYPGKIWKEEPIEEILRAFNVDTEPDEQPFSAIAAAEERSDEAGKKFELWREGNDAIVGIRASDTRERPVDWLWKGRLPAGCGLVISGSPGTNKSMLGVALAACVTNGHDWPDGEKNTLGPREVLIAATEDDFETTIKPRLMAAGADCSKVIFLANIVSTDDDGRPVRRELDLNGDTARLLAMLRANPQILMVILDPLTGFFGDTDGNDNKKIRPMMQRIAKVCRLTRTAFVLLIHENKRSDANAIDRILGAGAVSQVVRAGLRISKDPKNKPDGRIMANIKGNLSRDNGGMRFSVAGKNVAAWDGQTLEDIGFIEWGEKHGMSADDAMDEERQAKKGGGEDGKLGQAVKIFEEALIGGKRLHRDVHTLLDAAGISAETKRRARWKLGVKSSRSAPWYWWLPGGEDIIAAAEQTMTDVEVM